MSSQNVMIIYSETLNTNYIKVDNNRNKYGKRIMVYKWIWAWRLSVRIVRRNLNSSFIVKGCAGSGKTVLALWRAKELAEQGNNVK